MTHPVIELDGAQKVYPTPQGALHALAFRTALCTLDESQLATWRGRKVGGGVELSIHDALDLELARPDRSHPHLANDT